MKIRNIFFSICLLCGLFLANTVYAADYGSLKNTVVLPGCVNEMGGITGHFIPGQLQQNDILMFRLPMGAFWTTANIDSDESAAMACLQSSPEWGLITSLNGSGMQYGNNYNYVTVPAVYAGNGNGLFQGETPTIEVSSLVKGEIMVKITGVPDNTRDCYICLYPGRVYIPDNVTGNVSITIESPSNQGLNANVPGGTVPELNKTQEKPFAQETKQENNIQKTKNDPIPDNNSAKSPRSIKICIGQNHVEVNGEARTTAVMPYVKQGRTYVSIRTLAEALGFNLVWEPELNTVTLKRDNKIIRVNIKEGYITSNEQITYVMDTPVEIVEPGYTMVPLRYIAQAMGAGVSWDPIDNSVLISE